MKYKQFNNTSLFLPDQEPAKVAAAWYFAKNNSDPMPALVTADESWSTYLGFYIFLETAIDATDETVLDALAATLAADASLDAPLHTGALWLSNASAPATIKTILPVSNDNIPTLALGLNLGFGNYNLPMFTGAPVNFNIDTLELQVGYPTPSGAQASAVDQGIRIPIDGALSGTATGQVMLNDFSESFRTGWAAGFKYASSGATGVQSQYYPMFNVEENRYLVFNLLLDPLHPFDSDRTSLTFTGVSFRLEKVAESIDQFQIISQEEPNLLQTYFKTLYGKSISVRPVLSGTSPAQLIFQKCADPATGQNAYYLAPKGTFELCIPGGKGAQVRMLCGLAGTECFLITPGDGIIKGDSLIFYPGKGAYTKDFPVVTPSAGLATAIRSTVSETLLNTTYTAAWACIQPAQANPDIIYYAAPGAASLYTPEAAGDVFSAYYAETARFVSGSAGDGNSFPIVPYAGITHQQTGGLSATDIKPFELQIIGATRKQIIAQLPVIDPDELLVATDVFTTTPQGLLATIAGGIWKEVLLARNTGLPNDFAFMNLPIKLRNVFQTNELFLVASDAANLGDFSKSIGIEGWTFNVNVPTRVPDEDPQHKNILLLKFRNGTILDLIQDVNSWTDAQSFNYDADQVVGTQTWLIQYCNDAITMAQSNDRYAHFASIVQDPNWYGVLSLKVDVSTGGFPKDLKGLLGAMDIGLLNAHHVGVQVNYIEPSKGLAGDQSISVKKSNLFALISYIDPGYQDSQGGGQSMLTSGAPSLNQVNYAYKVLTLQIVFLNSAITNFESKLQLTARQWFDENATLNKPGSPDGKADQPANYAMLFNGHYENHDGHKTYTFLTQKGQTYQYFISSKILNYVQFIKASFSTVSSVQESPGSPVEKVNSVFVFYGYLNYLPLENFDCFSYGSETGAETLQNRGLYFSNMALNVSFKLDTEKNTTTDLSMVFSPGQIAFDVSLSAVRKASFAQGFPLSPSAILTGSGDNAPPQSGYVQVVPPTQFITGTLGSKWYGLDFELHWGGPGALADQAGFTPHLLLAWSPSANQSMGIFIRLPGAAGGGKTFSLQNILKLTAGTFRIEIVEHGQDQISYNLLLTSIAMSVIGVKFPPVGNVNLALLGDPAQPGSLGWYGAYVN
jgi:hypothetical protein